MTDIIVGEDDTMLTGVPPTIVVAKVSHAHMEETTNREINKSTTRAWRRSIVRIIVTIIDGNPVITGITRDRKRSRQVVETRMWGMGSIEISANFTESATGPTVVDHHNPAIKVVLHGQEVIGCIIDGGSGVNVISKTTCSRLGITEWEPCPF